jgi:DNA-binding transcriptional LysR family regulator
MGELLGSDWVLREPGSGTRSTFEAALEAHGIAPQSLSVVLELPTNESVREAVKAGAGATVISELVVAPGLQLGTLHAVDLDLPNRWFHVLRHRERYRSKAAQAFLDAVRGAREGQNTPA